MAEGDVTGNIVVNLDNTPAAEGAKKVEKAIADLEKKAVQNLGNVEKKAVEAGEAVAGIGTKAKGAGDQLAAAAKKQASLAVVQAQGTEWRATSKAKEEDKKNRQIAVAQEIGTQRRFTQAQAVEGKQRLALFRSELTEKNRANRAAITVLERDSRRIDTVLRRTFAAPAAMQAKVAQALQGTTAVGFRQSMVQYGGTASQAIHAQLIGAGLSPAEATFLAGGGGVRPLSLGGPVPADQRRAEAEQRRLEQRQQRESERATRQRLVFLKRQQDADERRQRAEQRNIDRQVRYSVRYYDQMEKEQERNAARLEKQQRQATLAQERAMRLPAGQMRAFYRAQGEAAAAPTIWPEDVRGTTPTNFFPGGPTIPGTPPPPKIPRGVAARGNGLWRGGGWQRLLGGGAGGFAAGLLGGLGVGVGGYAVARAGRAVIDSTQTAVAYDRQRVAAERLAGSQDKLNQLLDTYGKASGGAIDKTTTLEKVTRLLATGFADTVQDVDRFVKATRGASIALAKPQDYVIQETQLAISNTSVKRLDQIGLGITEVQDRIKALRAENKEWSRETAFQEAVLGLMEEKYGALTNTLEGQKTGLEKLTAAWSDLLLALGQRAKGQINAAARALAALLDVMSGANPTERQQRVAAERAIVLRRAAIREDQQYREKGFLNTSIYDLIAQVSGKTPEQVRAGFLMSQGLTQTSVTNGGYIGGPDQYRAVTPGPRYGEDALALGAKALEDLNRVESDYWRARIDETRQYEEQRSNIIRDYAKANAREEEDFQRQRARSQRDYELSLSRMRRDAADRDAEMLEDLNDRLADLREDNDEKVKDIEEKYREDREEAEKEHRDRLLSAAGQLDAIAVLEERKRWKRENEDREKAHKDALDDQRKNLQKQIDEAKEAYEERLADAREADAKRLQDMAEDRARQLQDEDEDRATRKARAEEDFQDQLDELDRQHELTLQKLQEEAEANRQAIAAALEADLEELGIYIEGMREKMDERNRQVEVFLDKFIETLEKKFAGEDSNRIEIPVKGGPVPVPTYASGGYVPVTGPAMLHAGEYVLSRDMLAGTATFNGASYNSRSIMVQHGAIQIQTTPGMEFKVADLVEERMIALLGEV